MRVMGMPIMPESAQKLAPKCNKELIPSGPPLDVLRVRNQGAVVAQHLVHGHKEAS